MRQARPCSRGYRNNPDPPKRIEKLLLVSPPPPLGAARPRPSWCCNSGSCPAGAAQRFPKTSAEGPQLRRCLARPLSFGPERADGLGVGRLPGRRRGRERGRWSHRRARDPQSARRPAAAPAKHRARSCRWSPSRGRGGPEQGAGRGRGGPAPALFFFFFSTLKASVAFSFLHRSRARAPCARSQQEPGSKRWRPGRGKEATSLPAAGASSAPESWRRRRPPRSGRQARARGLGGSGFGRMRAGICKRTWGSSGHWRQGRVPAGDQVGCAGSPSFAVGAGRGVEAPPSTAPAAAGTDRSHGPQSHLRGRDGARVPAAPATVAPRVEFRRLQTQKGGPGRAAAPSDLWVRGRPGASGPATILAAEAGAPTGPSARGQRDPAPRSYFRFSRPPGPGSAARPEGPPRGSPALPAAPPPGSPPGNTPGGAALPAAPEPPRLLPATQGEPSALLGNKIKTEKAEQPGSVGGNCPVQVQGKSSWER